MLGKTAGKFYERPARMSTAITDKLLQESVMSTGSREASTLQGYTIPKMPEQDLRKNINILNWKIYKLPARGKQTFLDDVVRYEKRRIVPECKLELSNWSKEQTSKALHGHETKDCFHNKSPRIMIADQIVKVEKEKAVPPLGTHNPVYSIVEPRIRNLPKSTVERGQLTADAEFKAQQTPEAKYDFEKGEKLTQPKSLFAKIYEKRQGAEEQKQKRSKEPDMNTYDSPRAYHNTQIHGVARRGVRIHPGTKKTFLDESPKATKFVPPPGHYKGAEKAYAKLSQSPRSIRVNRH